MEVSIQEKELSRHSKVFIGSIALLQGLALLWLHTSLEIESWPYGNHTITYILGLVFLFIPITITLSYQKSIATLPYWATLIGLTILLTIIGWHGAPEDSFRRFRLFEEGLFIALGVLWFVILFMLKAWLRDKQVPPTYQSQFGFSWHVYLTLKLSILFTAIFYGVLVLWGALFKIVNIDFFQDLFSEKWFLYPALSIAFAYAAIMFRTQINAVGAVQRILRVLISLLLPLLCLIALMFVLVLPFTGVDLIWEKGFGTGTIIGFVALTLFFFNAVFQDGIKDPYGLPILNQGVKYSVFILVFFCALGLYGLGLRIQQYGWTVDRLWGVILVIITASFITLYSLIIAFKKHAWSHYFGRANTLMAMMIAVLCFALLTPILDLRQIALNSQMGRLESGEIVVEDFDFFYIASLGNTGIETLKTLKSQPDIANNKEVSDVLQHAIESKGNRYYQSTQLTVSKRAKFVTMYPKDQQIDEKAWSSLNQAGAAMGCETGLACYLIAKDLNNDGLEELLFLNYYNSDRMNAYLVKNNGGQYITKSLGYNIKLSAEEVEIAITEGTITKQPSEWHDIQIGDTRILTGVN